MKPNLPLPHKTPKFGFLQTKDYDDHIQKISREKEKLEKSLKNSKENKFSIAKSFSKEKEIGLICKKNDNFKSSILQPNNQKDNFFIRQRSKDSLTELNCLESKDHSLDFYNLCEHQENLQNDSLKKLDEYKEKDPKPKIQDKIKFINDLFDNIQNKKEPLEHDSSPETSLEKPEIPVVKPALPVEKPDNPIKFIYKPKNHNIYNNYMTHGDEEEIKPKKMEKRSHLEKPEKNEKNNDSSFLSNNNEGKDKFLKDRSPLKKIARPLSYRIGSEIQKENGRKINEETSSILSKDSKRSPIKKSAIYHHKSATSTNLDSIHNMANSNKTKSPLKKSIVKNLMEANKLKNGMDKKVYKAYETVLKSFEKDVEWNREQNKKNKSPLKNKNFDNLVDQKNRNSISPLKRAEKSPVSMNRGRKEGGKNGEIPNVKKFYEGNINNKIISSFHFLYIMS